MKSGNENPKKATIQKITKYRKKIYNIITSTTYENKSRCI